VTLDRSTLCNWVGRACWWLEPLYELILAIVLSSPKVVADDTTLPVLDPGRGRYHDRTSVVLMPPTTARGAGPVILPPPTSSTKTARVSTRLVI
jgi:hypothetical protein